MIWKKSHKTLSQYIYTLRGLFHSAEHIFSFMPSEHLIPE